MQRTLGYSPVPAQLPFPVYNPTLSSAGHVHMPLLLPLPASRRADLTTGRPAPGTASCIVSCAHLSVPTPALCRADPDVLWLHYEDLHQDLPAAVRLVAEFLGMDAGDPQLQASPIIGLGAQIELQLSSS